MAGAIFDAILVHIVNTVAQTRWQGLRKEMCEALNLKKTEHTLGIISTTYADTDIFFLQEVAKEFITTARKEPRLAQFEVVVPTELGKRDQNSVIFLNRNIFNAATVDTSPTEAVWDALKSAGGKVPVATGEHHHPQCSDCAILNGHWQVTSLLYLSRIIGGCYTSSRHFMGTRTGLQQYR